MTPETPAGTVARALRAKALLDEVALVQARLLLARARAERPDIWSGAPLVSVRIPTYDRPRELVERAIASALAQTYPHLEIVVVGDHAGPATAAAMARVTDPRVRYEDLPARPAYPAFPRFFWSVAGVAAVNRALALCRGEWIAPLDDDDAFTPDHVEALLEAARRERAELVYGRMSVRGPDGWTSLGEPPLRKGHICHGAVLYSARLLCLSYDPLAWLLDEPGDWNLWRRMEAIGARIAFLPRVVGIHHPEHSAVADGDRADLATREATPEQIVEDLTRTGARDLLLALAPPER